MFLATDGLKKKKKEGKWPRAGRAPLWHMEPMHILSANDTLQLQEFWKLRARLPKRVVYRPSLPKGGSNVPNFEDR